MKEDQMDLSINLSIRFPEEKKRIEVPERVPESLNGADRFQIQVCQVVSICVNCGSGSC